MTHQNPYFDLFTLLESCPEELRQQARKKLIWAFSWAVPTAEVIRAIASLGTRVVEVGAGTGYWAWILIQEGCAVTAYDSEPHQPPRWAPIHPGGPEMLVDHSADTLLLCWPPLDDSMAENALRRYTGQRVVYVGEPEGGRTAGAGFHQLLRQNWKLEQELAIPQWPGMKDSVWIYSPSA